MQHNKNSENVQKLYFVKNVFADGCASDITICIEAKMFAGKTISTQWKVSGSLLEKNSASWEFGQKPKPMEIDIYAEASWGGQSG